MKLADAEQLLALEKRQGPIKEYWSALTDEGILLEAWPLGFARGSRALIELSVRPHTQFSALFTGGKVKRVAFSSRGGQGVYGSGLWEQEFYVYMKELKQEIAKAMFDLQTAPFMVRKSESEKVRRFDTDVLPHREDFENVYGQIKSIKQRELSDVVEWNYEGISTAKNPNYEIKMLKQGFCELLHSFIQGDLPWQQTEAEETAKVLFTNMPFYIIPSKPRNRRKGTSSPSPS